MCTFITLIAATDDLDRMNAILATWDRRGYSRRAERIATLGLRACLAPDEREYLLTRLPCDCGTYLGSAVRRSDNSEEEHAVDIARYRRKGWSEARIARAMADKGRVAARHAHNPTNDDGTYWIDLLTALAEGLGLQKIGLIHHFYTKSPGAEPDMATRREAGNLSEADQVLPFMEDGVIYGFQIKAPPTMKQDMRDLLPKLRQIGFEIWDPLNLSRTWVEGEPMADEYDSYLISAFGKAANRHGIVAICEALREAEVRMGLVDDGLADCRERAAREILKLVYQRAAG